MVRLAVPMLAKSSVWAGPVVPTGQLPKLNGFWLGAAWGPVPIPLKITVCVLPAIALLLSVMVNMPVMVPAVVGEKVTLIVQEPLGARLAPQLLVSPKEELTAMLLIVSVAAPPLLKVSC
jgi:hypothetical protein